MTFTIKLDKTFVAICLLSLSGAVLLAANFFATPARANMVIKDRDYQVLTARVDRGGEGLYIVDNRTGLMAVFTYDQARRTMVGRAVRPVSDAFDAK